MNQKKLKNLPLGEQTFKDIIEKNKLYVDKTEEIYKLLETEEKYFFLSRPRRFGKSLLISTLEEIFNGNKELFKGLYIYDKIDFKKYPVIKLMMNDLRYSGTIKDFENSLLYQIKNIYKENNLKLETDDYVIAFKDLIYKLSKIEKVVLLIDEYDKPIIEYIEDIERSKEMRNLLKNFYETIKANDEYIHFVFLTGVSKFSKVSVFSALNNITDITINKHYSKIVGIDESQLYIYFKEYIEKLSEENKISVEEIKNVLREWYNGYSWDGKNFLYNPYSLLSVFNSGDISNYWFKTGTPTFLINLIKEYQTDIKTLDNIILTERDFSTYDVEDMNIYALLFQTGYLTIKKIIERSSGRHNYVLAYPNLEVKESFLQLLLDDLSRTKKGNGVAIGDLIDTLKDKDLKHFFNILNSIFGGIPNEIFPEKTKLIEKEGYYHTIFHLIFTLIGTSIQSEVSTSKGRVDSVVETEDTIYLFEFKVGRKPQKAIDQIEEKKYYEKYLSSKKEILLIGVNFSIAKRNIKDWKIKNTKT
jgi:hypothetical protein